MRFAQRTEPRTPDGAPNGLANREIIARQQAMWPHPKTQRMIEATNVTQLLLAPTDEEKLRNGTADGDTAFECNQCGHVRATVHGVMSHIKTHLGKPSEPLYPMETVRLIVRMVKQADRDGYKNQSSRVVAEALNAQGVPTRDGEPWTAPRVYGVYRRWSEKVRVRVSGRRPIVIDPTPVVEAVECPDIVDEARDLVKSLRQSQRVAEVLVATLQTVEPLIDKLEKAVTKTQVADEETIKKAQRWDEMHRLFTT